MSRVNSLLECLLPGSRACVLWAGNQEDQCNAFKLRHSIEMSPARHFWNSIKIFTFQLSQCQPTGLQMLPFFISVPQSFTPSPKMQMVSPPERKTGREKATFCVWGHSYTQFPVWQCNTLTIWVTGPSPTVTSISRSIYQFNNFIFLITKLLSLRACAERLWLLIKMELY